MGLKTDLIIAKIRAAQVHDPAFKYEGKIKESFEEQAHYEAKAILNFLTEIHFTVDEFKASVQLETLETTDSLDANIKMTRTMSMMAIQIKILKMMVDLVMAPIKWLADVPIGVSGVFDLGKPFAVVGTFIKPIDDWFKIIMKKIESLIPKTEGLKEVEIPALDLKQSGGQGASMTAVGHAYVGLNDPVPGSDTNVNAMDNDFTKVVLIEENIPADVIEDVETGKEELMG